MVDRQHAQEFLDRLPKDDPFRLVEEVSFWLKALREAYGVVPKRAFEVLDLFDQTANGHQRRLTAEFVALGSRYRKYQAQRIWNTSFQYARELGATYQHLLEQYRKGTIGSDLLRPVLPVIVARAIRALRLELKWSLLRHGPIDQLLWQMAGELYAYAEENRFVTEKTRLYPGEPDASSAEREYLQALMLGISATDGLVPEHAHLVDHLIQTYAEYFALERAPRPGCHYYAVLRSAKAPARLVERIAPSSAIRYFGPDKAAGMIDRTLESINQRGMVPPELNPDGLHKPAAILHVLDHLASHWGASPPIRGSQRTAAAVRISVVHDFESIMSMVSGESQELDFNSNVEIWNVENESQGGFGAVITETVSDWIEIGSLLGIRMEEGATWGIGLVRRLNSPAEGVTNVGIEYLSRGAVKVNLTRTPTGPSAPVLNALMLLSSDEGSASKGEVSMMLSAGALEVDQRFTMRALERTYVLLPKKVVESGQGYELTRFSVRRPEA
jgi:cyclic-di-GMP-binding protein